MLEFVEPASPVLRSTPPRGPDWLHEAKFDGWRIQLHKDGSVVRLYTKSGYDCTTRFGVLGSAVAAVPARSCIIDGPRSTPSACLTSTRCISAPLLIMTSPC